MRLRIPRFSGFGFGAYLLVQSCLVQAATAGDFTQFRGSNGTGVTQSGEMPTTWSDEAGIAWKVPNPGAGWSQPVIWKDRIYITAAVSAADVRLKPANFSEGLKSPQSMGISMFAKPPDAELEWKVFCLGLADGKLVWEQTIARGKPSKPIHPSNSWATETPVVNETGVCAFFGAAGQLGCVSHDGSVLWVKETGVYDISSNFGTGSSLAGHQGRVYLQQFTEETADLRAFDVATGEELWKFSRPEPLTSWSSPLIWKNAVREELIVSGGQRIDSLDPATGKAYWTLTNVKAATACSPCADEKHLYFGGSDPFSKGPLFAIKAGANGEISPEKENGQFEGCAWLEERQGPGMASPVSSGQFVYTTDNNILKCFDAATGQRLYQTRLPGMEQVAASPILSGERLLLIDENGHSCVVKVGPKFEVLGEGQLTDVFWSTPAVGDGLIIFRGVESIYCVRIDSAGAGPSKK